MCSTSLALASNDGTTTFVHTIATLLYPTNQTMFSYKSTVLILCNQQSSPIFCQPTRVFNCTSTVPVSLRNQVLNKQVVTRTSGRSLGCISGAWLDPARGTLVSFDLDDRKPGSGSGLGLSSPARAGNIPLSALRQVGQGWLMILAVMMV